MSLERANLLDNHLKRCRRKGHTAFKEKKFNEAAKYFKRGLKFDEFDFDCLAGLGYVYIKKKQFIEALQQFQAALAINPYADQLYSPIAHCYFQLGLFSRSIEYYTLSLKTESSETSSYESKGFASLSLGNYLQMRKCFAEILEIEPENNEARCYYSLALILTNQNKEACRHLNYYLQQPRRRVTKFSVLAKLEIYIIFYPFLPLHQNFHLPIPIIDLILKYDDTLLQENDLPRVPTFIYQENPVADIALLKPIEQAEVHYLLGTAYRTIGEFALTHESFVQALLALDDAKTSFSELSLSIHMQIAFTYQKQHRIELAIKTLKEVNDYCAIENEDVLQLIKNLESKRMLATPSKSHTPLQIIKNPNSLLFIPKEKKSDNTVHAISPQEADSFRESFLHSPDSNSSTATTARSMINSPSESPVAISPSSSPISERKRISTQPLPALNLAPPSMPNALNQVQPPRTLAIANQSGLFKPSPFIINLNAPEVKITTPPTKSRCVIL